MQGIARPLSGTATGALLSPGREAKCITGGSVQGVHRSAPSFLSNAGALEAYVEYREQGRRSHGGAAACFDRQPAGKAANPWTR